MAGRRGSREFLSDRFPRAQVLQDDVAGTGGRRGDGHADDVAGGHGHAGEVDGVVRVPLVPGVVGYSAAGNGEVDA